MFLQDLLFALKDLVLSPFREPSLLWQLTPVLILWLIIGFYFAFHKQEKLGWNTALGNGVSLFWIVVSAMQHIFDNNLEYFTWAKFFFLIVVTVYAGIVIYISFEHAFSSKVTYLLASHHIVYYLSIISLLYSYDQIYFTLPMLIALLLVFGVILLASYIMKRFLPEMDEGERTLVKDEFDDFSSKDDAGISPGGIEEQMGKKTLANSKVKY